MSSLDGEVIFVKSQENDLTESLLERLDETEVIDLTSKLIKLQSVNPPGDTKDITRYLTTYLKDKGLDPKIIEPEQGKCGILLSAGRREIDKTLVLNGHMDVVPPGDTSQWDFPPFSGKLEDGYVHGRGASDMKGGLAGLVVAFVLAATTEEIPGQLQLMLVPDEETGGQLGTKYFLENFLEEADGCLIAEPSGKHSPTTGQKGSLWLEISTKGIPAHGSLYPLQGESAIMAMQKVIEVLSELPETPVEVPEKVKQVVELSQEVIEDEEGKEGLGEALHTITCNVGTIQGGDKVNKVPESCRIEADLRIPFGKTAEGVLEALKGKLEDRGVIAEVKKTRESADPNYTLPEEEIVDAVLKSLRTLQDEVTPNPTFQWASSDAKFFRQQGIPTLQYGPAELEGIHSFNEKVSTEDLIFATKVYLATIGNFMAR